MKSKNKFICVKTGIVTNPIESRNNLSFKAKTPNNRTFREILSSVEDANLERIKDRVWRANQIAKVSTGVFRRRAYQIKVQSLAIMVHHFTKRVRLRYDPHLPKFVVVGIQNSTWGLHVPADRFLFSSQYYRN